MMQCRGIRGATTVTENAEPAILEATHELLTELLRLNDLDPNDIASIIFTSTTDLNATFPAQAARAMGLTMVPLLCAQEIEVPNALGRCVRVLLHVNTARSNAELAHVYLRDAVKLRPELAGARTSR